MKRILPFVIILVLAIVVVIQYRKLQRLSPPEAYEYQFRDDVDAGYHDPMTLRAYYDTGYMVGSFAREMWKSRGLNVRHPDSDNSADRIAVQRYNQLRATADSLGAQLARSTKLKAQGFNNNDIQAIEGGGVSPAYFKVQRTFGATTMQKGDQKPGVLWLQEKLAGAGYQIPLDGYFWTETETAVREYQKKNQLDATGIADWETLYHIMNN